VMGWFSADWALLFNVYFLLGFPLIAMSAMAVFRHFRVPYGPALVGSVLYSFLPSRLIKGEGHIFLDVFFHVPLALLVVLWVCGERPPLVRDRAERRFPAIEVRDGRTIAAIVICAVTSSSGLYYAFFTCFLLVAGGLWASIRRRASANAVAGVALTGIIVAGVAANGLPTLLYRAQHGPNPEVAERHAFESELFALKPVQLLLPADDHRVPALARFKQRYLATSPNLGEGGSSSLGVMGSIGFIVLLGSILTGSNRPHPRAELFRSLSLLNLLALFLGTVGGLGSLFALLVTPQIRAYARVNVIIGFLALFAVVLLLERLERRHRRLVLALAPVVLILGLLDQATARAVRPYAAVKEVYASDAQLVRHIEATVPKDAMIFQLPYVSFPEVPPVHRMNGYDPIRPYLHSRSLRWSQPTMRGRSGDGWLSLVSRRTPRELIETLSDAGFAGILVDRHGYQDGAAAIEAILRGALGVEPMVSSTGRLSFFNLGPFNQAARNRMTPEEQERRRDLALHPLLFFWRAGFSNLESAAGRTWRWCDREGELVIENGSRNERLLSIKMTLAAANPPARLTIDSALVSERLELAPMGTAFTRTLKVPPGRHMIRFRSDGKPASAPNDPRVLIWRAEDPVVEQVPGPEVLPGRPSP
jgi:hypothetical protein